MIPEITANEPIKFKLINQHHSNYEFASDIFNLYVDFNRSILRDITIENKSKFDMVYNKDSNLLIKTIDGSCKVFTNNSIESENKYYELKFSDLAFRK